MQDVGQSASGPASTGRRGALTRPLAAAIAVAVLVRSAVFLVTMRWPVANERGVPVAPGLPQGYFDYDFYVQWLGRFSESWPTVVLDFVRFYQDPFHVVIQVPGPLFPALLGLTGFATGFFWPLLAIYLVLSIVTAAAWLWWLSSHGVGGPWLIAFALIPAP